MPPHQQRIEVAHDVVELYRLAQQEQRGIATALRINAADADDIMMSTIEKIWRNRRSKDGEGMLLAEPVSRGYVNRSMRNVGIDHLRRTQRAKQSLERAATAESEFYEPGGLSSTALEQLRLQLAELSADERDLLEMAYEGASAAKLATRLGVTADTLYQRLHRIRRRLRALLPPLD